MKYLIPIALLNLPLTAKAQFVVGNTGMTIKTGTVFAVDNLVIQPAADITIQNNALQRNMVAVPAGSGNSIERVYQFSAPLAIQGTIGFYYNDAELAGNPENNLNLVHTDNPVANSWTFGSNGNVNPSDNYIYATANGTPVSRITASAAAPLSVMLVSFTALKDGSGAIVLLDWNVANEKNLKEYSIEKSGDAKTFSIMGTVSATGKTAYHLADEHPFEGKNYYRLKMTDQDGSFSYSQVALLTFSQINSGIQVYPSPVREGNITIVANGWLPSTISVSIADVSGRVMHRCTLEGSTLQINVSGWPPGNYLVRLSNGAMGKFIKQ